MILIITSYVIISLLLNLLFISHLPTKKLSNPYIARSYILVIIMYKNQHGPSGWVNWIVKIKNKIKTILCFVLAPFILSSGTRHHHPI